MEYKLECEFLIGIFCEVFVLKVVVLFLATHEVNSILKASLKYTRETNYIQVLNYWCTVLILALMSIVTDFVMDQCTNSKDGATYIDIQWSRTQHQVYNLLILVLMSDF